MLRESKVPETTQALRTALSGVSDAGGRVAVLQVDASRAFEELATAMRRMGRLADYLERHPEALLSGRKAPSGKEP
jgi:hypothetical protein